MIRKNIVAIVSTAIILSSRVEYVNVKEYKGVLKKARAKQVMSVPVSPAIKNGAILSTDRVINTEDIKVSYNSHDITASSNSNVMKMRRALTGTSMENLASYFIEAEQIYDINAFFLAGLIATESAWNTSQRAREQNNITGHAVYNNASRGSSFSNKRQCIMATAKLLHESYVTINGEFYTGADIQEINRRYSVSDQWASTINDVANKLVTKANSN